MVYRYGYNNTQMMMNGVNKPALNEPAVGQETRLLISCSCLGLDDDAGLGLHGGLDI